MILLPQMYIYNLPSPNIAIFFLSLFKLSKGNTHYVKNLGNNTLFTSKELLNNNDQQFCSPKKISRKSFFFDQKMFVTKTKKNCFIG